MENGNGQGAPLEIKERDFGKYCGVVLEQLGKGYCRTGCQMEQHHLNYIDIVHGGVTFTLMDIAAGKAALSLREEGSTVVTQCADVHFLRPVRKGHICADARVVKSGRKTAFSVVDLLDEAGTVCAHGEFEIFYIDKKRSKPE